MRFVCWTSVCSFVYAVVCVYTHTIYVRAVVVLSDNSIRRAHFALGLPAIALNAVQACPKALAAAAANHISHIERRARDMSKPTAASALMIWLARNYISRTQCVILRPHTFRWRSENSPTIVAVFVFRLVARRRKWCPTNGRNTECNFERRPRELDIDAAA